MYYKKIVYALAVSGLLLAPLTGSADEAVRELSQEEKIKARLAEIAAEEKAAKITANG
jgi:hypothetical protein